MSAELAVQKAIRARLIGSAGLTALVPAAAILDRNERPASSPAIILGESQSVDEGDSLSRSHTRVFHTIHVWLREPSLEGVKRICGEIRAALKSHRPDLGAFHCADWRVSGMRYLRDGDGVTSHGVVTVDVLVSGDG
ncbi:DUF3168 domain-containing protein [Celeribacter indicus]|uniref:DUF3168 domain-containing protein n=1 Tax=Celeribacter indicus TaxID=1208324 RepID=A0A0B5E2E7_9RHOB|nr:DUF3168 domain-containing protein [Celeribacter indicus]AJE47186.1 hypothetical protein P73_2471 [Celeribacter indicus]SDW00281.1 Protein of unknown function [Celeribacter indicus]